MPPINPQLILHFLQQLFAGGGQQPGAQPATGTIPPAPGSVPGEMPPGQPPDNQNQAENRKFVGHAMNQGILHGNQGQHVRLGIDGLPVDPDAPTGLGWLEAHGPGGHSWDQTYQNPPQTQYSAAETQQPQHTMVDTNQGRFAIGSVGQPVGHYNMGSPQMNLPTIFDPRLAPTTQGEAHFGPFLPSEQAKLRGNLQSQLNKGVGAGTSGSATTGGNWFQQAFQ